MPNGYARTRPRPAYGARGANFGPNELVRRPADAREGNRKTSGCHCNGEDPNGPLVNASVAEDPGLSHVPHAASRYCRFALECELGQGMVYESTESLKLPEKRGREHRGLFQR